VKQKLALAQAGTNDSDGENESDEEDENWGGKKRVYYGDEEVDVDVCSFPVPHCSACTSSPPVLFHADCCNNTVSVTIPCMIFK
jgi:hypothetical protein